MRAKTWLSIFVIIGAILAIYYLYSKYLKEEPYIPPITIPPTPIPPGGGEPGTPQTLIYKYPGGPAMSVDWILQNRSFVSQIQGTIKIDDLDYVGVSPGVQIKAFVLTPTDYIEVWEKSGWWGLGDGTYSFNIQPGIEDVTLIRWEITRWYGVIGERVRRIVDVNALAVVII